MGVHVQNWPASPLVSFVTLMIDMTGVYWITIIGDKKPQWPYYKLNAVLD